MRYFSFYSEDFEGISGTDFHVEISELEDGTILAEVRNCGRSRGSFWSDSQNYYTDHFWLTVQDVVNHFGGMKNISNNRIGCIERW